MEFVQPCELSQRLANILQRKGLTAKAEYITNNLTHFITLMHASLLLCKFTLLLSPAFGSYIALSPLCILAAGLSRQKKRTSSERLSLPLALIPRLQ